MAPQALGDPTLAERKEEGLEPSEEVQKPGKHGPRKRVSQACDRCRSRKDKCDGKKPVSPHTTHCSARDWDVHMAMKGASASTFSRVAYNWGMCLYFHWSALDCTC